MTLFNVSDYHTANSPGYDNNLLLYGSAVVIDGGFCAVVEVVE